MPENNFEKKVQQRMEELKLQPSGTVWENVYEKIRKEKKRRRFVFWFFLFSLLLLGGGGWWFLNNKNETPVPGNIIENKNVIISSPDQKKPSDISDDKGTKNTLTRTPEKNKKPGLNNRENLPGHIVNNRVSKIDRKSNIDKKDTTNVVSKVIADVEKKDDAPDAYQKNDQPVDEPVKKNTIPEDIAKDSIVSNIKTDSVTKPVSQKQPEIPVQAAIQDSIKKEPHDLKKDSLKNKKSRWEWSIVAGTGLSNATDGFFSIFDNRSALADYAGPQTSPAVPPTKPSTTRNGLFLETGLQIKRKLNEKFGVSSGLFFSAYSNVQPTGSFRDTSIVINSGFSNVSVSGVYNTGEARSFTNHYYYLRLPVAFHWQFNKGNKIPLLWQNEISWAALISSKTLFYNASYNFFYRDEDLINKSQWIYRTVFSTQLFNKTDHPLFAGLQFDYHLRSLHKQTTMRPSHLSLLGIRLGWIIKK